MSNAVAQGGCAVHIFARIAIKPEENAVFERPQIEAPIKTLACGVQKTQLVITHARLTRKQCYGRFKRLCAFRRGRVRGNGIEEMGAEKWKVRKL